ncbi:MAG: hypothetical protein ACRD8O_16465, partial [Bryobacteraceae bacterium]
GSTRWLWKDQDVREAIRYVVEEQGGRAVRRANRSLTLAAQLQVAPRTDPPCDHSYVAHLSIVVT